MEISRQQLMFDNISEMEWHRTGVLVWHRDKVGEVCTFVRFEWLTQEQIDKLAGMLMDNAPFIPPKRKKS